MSPIIQSSSFLVLNKISTREYLDDDGEVLKIRPKFWGARDGKCTVDPSMGVIRMGAGAGMGG